VATVDRSHNAIARALVGKNGPGGQEPPKSADDIKNPPELWNHYFHGFTRANRTLDKALEVILRRGLNDDAEPPDITAARCVDLAFRQIGVVEAEFAAHKGRGSSAEQFMAQATELHDIRVYCALLVLETGSTAAVDDLTWAVETSPSLENTPLAHEIRQAGGSASRSPLAKSKSVDLVR
jgi:hypothetical protein